MKNFTKHSADSLKISPSILITIKGIKHSCVWPAKQIKQYLLYTAATLLSETQTGFIRSSQMDKLQGMHSKSNCRVHKQERGRVLVGGKLKHLIKSKTASVNCYLSVVSLSLLIVSGMRFCSHATFLCYHVCIMSCYPASQRTIIPLRNWAPWTLFGRRHGTRPSAWHPLLGRLQWTTR